MGTPSACLVEREKRIYLCFRSPDFFDFVAHYLNKTINMPSCNTCRIITLIKQIDKMLSYNRDELINVFEKHSVYIVSAINLNS